MEAFWQNAVLSVGDHGVIWCVGWIVFWLMPIMALGSRVREARRMFRGRIKAFVEKWNASYQPRPGQGGSRVLDFSPASFLSREKIESSLKNPWLQMEAAFALSMDCFVRPPWTTDQQAEVVQWLYQWFHGTWVKTPWYVLWTILFCLFMMAIPLGIAIDQLLR